MEDIKVIHNSHVSFYREPFGAVTCGTKIKIAIDIESSSRNTKVQLEILSTNYKKTVEMNEVDNNGQRKTFSLYYVTPEQPCVLWYYFIIYIDDRLYYYSNNNERLGGTGILSYDNPKGYQITVHNPMKVPDWYKESIVYQIFADRFYIGEDKIKLDKYKERSLIHSDWYDTPYYIKDNRGHILRWDFFGGNLNGIIEKIDYLKQLGVTAIYLNPIFDSVSNHKYDTGNYKKIDPAYGDEETFEKLIEEAKKNNINILLDGVFSHTGSDSLYFNKNNRYEGVGAYQSMDSPYYKWYKFYNYPNEYDCWWGVDTLPNVNEMEPSYLDYIVTGKDSVIKHWLKKGIKGWRLDVADELPDEFIKTIKKVMKELNGESVLIGEVWEDASHKVSYNELRQYFWGDELDGVMNYPFRECFINFFLGNWDGEYAEKVIMSLYENYPRENFMASLNIIGSHDRIRIMTLLGESPDEHNLSDIEREAYRLPTDKYLLAKKRLKTLTLLQFTFPGVPCIYYGDEAGLEGYSDPYNRRTYPWGREDEEIIEWYKKLGKLRNDNDVFKKGDWRPYIAKNDIFSYYRMYKNIKVLCIFNRNTYESRVIPVPETFKNKVVVDMINNKEIKLHDQLVLMPLESKILLHEKAT